MKIRAAQPADATQIAALVARTLREVNARDYPADVVEKLAGELSPRVIRRRLARWQVVVAEDLVAAGEDGGGGGIVGAAALDEDRMRMFFVASDRQREGAGEALLERIEEMARKNGHETLEVRSSLTARSFYAKRGFIPIRTVTDRDHETVLMKKPLGADAKSLAKRQTASLKNRDSAFRGR